VAADLAVAETVRKGKQTILLYIHLCKIG